VRTKELGQARAVPYGLRTTAGGFSFKIIRFRFSESGKLFIIIHSDLKHFHVYTLHSDRVTHE
jgi:hypothetical protein